MEDIKKKNYKIRKNIIISAFLVAFVCIFFNMLELRAEYLEYKEIGQQYVKVFWTNVKYKYITMLVNFIIIFISTFITTKIIHRGLKAFFKDDNKEPIKMPNKSISFIIAILSSLVINFFVGDKIILFFNQTRFGGDLVLNKDIGYFLFQRPFYMAIINYITYVIIGLAIYSVAYYILAFNMFFERVSKDIIKKGLILKQIKATIICLAIVQAFNFYLKSENIVYGSFLSTKNRLTFALCGAGLTDATIKLWAYRIFPILIIICTLLALSFIKKAKYKKAVISLITLPTYLVVTSIVCFIFQVLVVNPNEFDKEKKYINYNIQATRQAYNINVEEQTPTIESGITEEIINKNQELLKNVNLTDSSSIIKLLNEFQSQKGYYSYNSADVAKYNINGEDKLVYVSAREINSQDNRTYTNRRYEYTHGYGVIVNSVNSIESDGKQDYILKDINSNANGLNITQPRIYFGELTNEHVIVNAKNVEEFDYPTASGASKYSYDGSAGINMNGLDRLIFATRLGDFQMIFSKNITSDSKLLLNRNIVERAKKVAPFLKYDEDPYLVIKEDGRLVWVLDAYTTSNLYPYSQTTVLEEKQGAFTTKTKINYIRNSVKVLVDAYDGTTTFYITDKTDPVIMAYWKAYPTMFVDIENSDISEDVWGHMKYSEYLFKIQAGILENYHETQPEIFYRNDNPWTMTITNSEGATQKVGSYYTAILKDDNLEQGLITTFSPLNRQNIIAYLVANNNSKKEYGKLVLYNFSKDSNILGPTQIDAQIDQNEAIKKDIKTWSTGGYKVVRNMTIVPIGNTFLYIEPIQIIALNESQVPYVKKIILASGNKLAIGDTFEETLNKLLSQNAVNIEFEDSEDLDRIIEDIIKANTNLKDSSGKNDWEMFGKDLQTLQDLIDQLEILQNEAEKKE